MEDIWKLNVIVLFILNKRQWKHLLKSGSSKNFMIENYLISNLIDSSVKDQNDYSYTKLLAKNHDLIFFMV